MFFPYYRNSIANGDFYQAKNHLYARLTISILMLSGFSWYFVQNHKIYYQLYSDLYITNEWFQSIFFSLIILWSSHQLFSHGRALCNLDLLSNVKWQKFHKRVEKCLIVLILIVFVNYYFLINLWNYITKSVIPKKKSVNDAVYNVAFE